MIIATPALLLLCFAYFVSQELPFSQTPLPSSFLVCLAHDRDWPKIGMHEERRAQVVSVFPCLLQVVFLAMVSCVSSMSPDPARQPLPNWRYLACWAPIVVLDPVRWLGFWALLTPSSPHPGRPGGGRAFLLMLLFRLSLSCPI